MSLRSKIEAVIYASEEPVTLAQLVVLLSEEAQAELDALAALQADLPLDGAGEPNTPVEGELDMTGLVGGELEAADAAQQQLAQATRVSIQEAGFEANATGEDAAALPASSPKSQSDETIAQKSGAARDEALPGSDSSPLSPETEKRLVRERERAIRDLLRGIVDSLIREYAEADRGLEIREVAGGFRFGTKPEYHDAVRGFVKSLKPTLKLSLQALETLAVVAYKQPVTAAEISEIRGVDSAGVLGGLLTRKLIQTAGRKQVIGRPMLYKTSKEFLVRFGLRDIQELPSMEEFERMAGELAEQEDLPMNGTDNIIERANARGDAEHIREMNTAVSDETASPAEEAGTAAPAREPAETPQTDTHEHTGASSAAAEAEPSSQQPQDGQENA